MRLFCFLLFHSVHSKFFTEKLIRNSNTLYNSSPSEAKGYRDRGEIIDNMVFFWDKGNFFWDVRLKKIGRVGNYFGMAGKTVWRGCKNMNLALMTPMTPMTPVCYCPPPPRGWLVFKEWVDGLGPLPGGLGVASQKRQTPNSISSKCSCRLRWVVLRFYVWRQLCHLLVVRCHRAACHAYKHLAFSQLTPLFY